MNQRRTAIPAPIPTLAAIALCALAALLSGCLLVPGHFTAALDVRRSGAFTYAYAGEIAMFPLTKLAQAGAAAEAADAAFQPSPCHETPTDNQAKPQGRPCTPAELAEQKQAWSKQQSARAETRKHEAESFKAMLGGLDPSDPKAGEQFAERLRKQQG